MHRRFRQVQCQPQRLLPDAAMKHCTPLHFSKSMAGAVAGRPIAIRFVDERTLAKSIDKTKSVQ